MHALKQDLHDALGEHGLAYWKALNGYLLGQVGRGEVVDLVRTWLKGKKGKSTRADGSQEGDYGHNADMWQFCSTIGCSSPCSRTRRYRHHLSHDMAYQRNGSASHMTIQTTTRMKR